MIEADAKIHRDIVFQELHHTFESNGIGLSGELSTIEMLRFVPRCRVCVFIIDIVGGVLGAGDSFSAHHLLLILNSKEVLMNSVLSIFDELFVDEFTLSVIVFDEQQIHGSRIFEILFRAIVVRFHYIELVSTTLCQCPSRARLYLIGDFLDAFQIFGTRFRVLMKTSIRVNCTPIGVHVTLNQLYSHLRRVFMQFVIILVDRRIYFVVTSSECQSKQCSTR